MAFAEKNRGWLNNVLTISGRVPFFYYLYPAYLVDSPALGLNCILYGVPYAGVSENHRSGLPLLYLVFIFVEVLLYFACRWYARYKLSHPEKI
ncbi:hypothetical protein ACCC92_08235 [Mucilaginibacter sp. Mucisp84]|uniref:hypothetical protein n=1 Tax=Mucilaginibacter sp. Mucisp84 TaxID=3243058 RepID=UPI0039A7863E